ncbi:PEGA domain-containing protein [Paracrocinitomix mangrovi]|uniref:PEGA domain-containing protein n=1 Tax=Paracrocinitomix mangrovi TaxID=2862509 RepID=UPI001C8D9A75|nr:PEGA domain-containing protein [Paracrocinitomix mangrovi]UKN02334.1 PEGA domain-containing protein [Paracrocinitomix mangrovi]
MNKLSLACFFIALILLQSCATTTIITSNVPDAEVYIGGQYKGTTPYRHKDKLPMGVQRKVEIKKEGYETYNTKIGKFDRVNGMAVFTGFVAIVPWLWSGTYKHYYQYELTPNGETNPLKSNFFEQGELFKTKKGYFSIYIGADTSHYLFNQGLVHILDSSMTHTETFDLEIKLRGTPIDAYMENGEKKIILLDEEKKRCTLLNIDSLRRSQYKDLEKVNIRELIVDDEYQYGYYRNKQTNKLICYTKRNLVAYNGMGKKQAKYSVQNRQIIEARILADDRLLVLESGDRGTLYLIVAKGEEMSTIEIDVSSIGKFGTPRLSVNEETGKAYVSGLKIDKEKKDIFINNAFVSTIDLGDFKELNFKKFNLKSPHQDEFLINKGVISDAENEILCVEKQGMIVTTTTSTSGGSSSTSTSSKMVTGNMALINFSSKEAKIKWIEKGISSSYHMPKLTCEFIIKNGKVYCFYNNMVNGRTFQVQSVFDTDLNYLSVNYRDNYKEDGALFHPIRSSETENGDLIFVMQYKKKLGITRATLD